MKLSLASSRRSVDAVICAGIATALNATGAQVDTADHRATFATTELDIDLPKIQGSIFLADFSHLLRGHG